MSDNKNQQPQQLNIEISEKEAEGIFKPSYYISFCC